MCMTTIGNNRFVDCENLEDIQQEAVNWLRNNAELTDGLNDIDHKLFYVLAPRLSKFLIDNKFFIKQIRAHQGAGMISLDEPYMVIPLESIHSPYIATTPQHVDTSLICTFFKVPEKYAQINNVTTF